MLHISLSIKDQAAYDALQAFIHSYQQQQGGIEHYRVVAADGDSDSLAETGLVPWKWYQHMKQTINEVQQTSQPESIHHPQSWSTLPEALKGSLNQCLKLVLEQLMEIDKGVTLNKSTNYDEKIKSGIDLLEYNKQLKARYVNASFQRYEGKIDYHQTLINLARDAQLTTLNEVNHYKMDGQFFKVVLNAAQALTAVASYLIEEYFDYFWGMVALIKAQQWLGIYIGGMSASDVSTFRNHSLGAEARALNAERVEDAILSSIIQASRHWIRREQITTDKKVQFSKTLKRELTIDQLGVTTELAKATLTRLKGRVDREYTVQDIKEKIINLIGSSKNPIYHHLMDYESSNPRAVIPNVINEADEICFYNEHYLRSFIDERLRSWLYEGLSVKEKLHKLDQLNHLSEAEAAMLNNSINDIFQQVVDPLTQLIKK